jgi:glycine betaine/proline transport system permease protein
VLFEIQIPLSMRTIMAGLNQTLMLSLSMVVIAALIGAEGLGLIVFRGIGRLDVGLAALGGIGIVLLAIVLDRITQALGDPKTRIAAAGRRRALLGRLRPGGAAEAGPAATPQTK